MKRALAGLLLVLPRAGVWAQSTNDVPRADSGLHYLSLGVDDARYVFTAPARWNSDDWLAAGGSVALIGGAALLDSSVSTYVHDHPNSSRDSLASKVEPFGAEYSFGVLAAFFAAGELADNTNAVAVAGDGLISSVIAAGIITPVLKIAVGRSRPKEGQGASDFHPFSGGASFPSGHTTQAFAIGATIAEHYDSWWVKIPAYLVPTLVGLARIQHDAHFASDVVAGAVIGTGVAHSVAHHNREAWGEVSLVPVMDGDMTGLAVTHAF